jgi:chromosome segregation ATPase
VSAFGPAEGCPDCNGLYQQLEEQGRTLAERTAERDALAVKVETMIARETSTASDRDFMVRYLGDLLRDNGVRAHENIAERLQQVSALARRKPDFDAHVSSDTQRLERRCEELEDKIARMRRIIDDADRVKDENETLRRDLAATRAELKALHDVLSGAKKVST